MISIFFLLIGLELEREIFIGELSDLKTASLPIFGALGGMIVPAGIFLLLNFGTPTQAGAGIPMATDIAFAVGILSLLGKRVPASLKVFLTALAVIDDLGAILVIAIFYTDNLSLLNLGIALGIWAVLFVMGKYFKVRNLIPYLIGGVAMWYFMLHSGVHATIAGVLLAFAIPFGDGGEKSTSYLLQHFLHKPVAFLIVPIFAFANTGIIMSGSIEAILLNNNSIGIIAGLVIGKPLGILLLCYTAVKLRIARLPEGVNWLQLTGAGVLAGIGFTMSIFITLLAFTDSTIVQYSKIAILLSSLVAGVVGFFLVKAAVKSSPETTDEPSHETTTGA